MISLQRAVLGMLLLTACGESTSEATQGDASGVTPCDQIIPGCEARCLENVVLRNGAEDGALSSADGLDTSEALTFDEALEAAWKNDFRGGSDTVQVILGASDVWGTEAGLYYAVQWGGVCPVDVGPGGYEPVTENCDGVWGTVIDAHTGDFIVSGM